MIGFRMTKTIDTTVALVESATLVGEAADSDGAWKVLIINEGKGSSGFYPAELLKTHASAFSNALSFKNHPTGWDGPESRDFTMIADRILGETWSEQNADGRMGIYRRYLPDPEYADRIERYRKQLGLSIYIEGAGDLNESGDFEVQWLNEADPYKSVDIVIAPGRGGKMAVESLRKMYSTQVEDQSGTESGQKNGEENEVDEKVLEALEALTTKIDTLVSAQEAVAQQDADAVEVEAEVSSAVEAYDAAIAAIDAAELQPAQVKVLRAEAKAGKDVAPLIEDAKALLKALEEDLAKGSGATGRVIEGSASTDNYTLKGFGGSK